jgi:hypothetical protein
MGNGGTEEGHNAVAQDLIHRGFVAMHGLHHSVQRRVEEAPGQGMRRRGGGSSARAAWRWTALSRRGMVEPLERLGEMLGLPGEALFVPTDG